MIVVGIEAQDRSRCMALLAMHLLPQALDFLLRRQQHRGEIIV